MAPKQMQNSLLVGKQLAIVALDLQKLQVMQGQELNMQVQKNPSASSPVKWSHQ